MKRDCTTRRSFLGSLAVLAAGAAISSPFRLFSQQSSSGLQQQWYRFYRQQGGTVFYGEYPDRDEYMLPDVPGHTYTRGKAVSFRQSGLLAIPVWIYWGGNKPADVCITLFERSVGVRNGYLPLEEHKVNHQRRVGYMDDERNFPTQTKQQALTGQWTSVRRINNYELQALNALSAEIEGKELLRALKEPSTLRKSRALSLRTCIKGEKARVKASISNKRITLEEKLISYYG